MAQQIRFNIANPDTATGKKMKYDSVEVRIQNGSPIEFIGMISFWETNDTTAIPINSTKHAKQMVASFTENFTTLDKFIDTVTKLYAIPDPANSANWVLASDGVTPVTNSVLNLSIYLEGKAINTFPGIAGSDAYRKLTQGLCKEMVAVRQANGELPV